MDAFLLVGAMLIAYFIIRKVMGAILDKNIKNITAEEVNKLLKENKNVVVLDVRTRSEYEAGHIPGAKHMPSGEINSRINELEKYKGKPIVVYCASGGRSPIAVRALSKHKFPDIYHMHKGLKTWAYKLKSK